ncbi:sugar transferase [Clostridium collagenovorans]
MKNEEVKKYYDILEKKKGQLFLKRLFDIVLAIVLIVILSPLILVLAIVIKLTSEGPVFFRQTRVTQYGRRFRIFKFRTMVVNAEKIGTQVTVGDDPRITKIGRLIRKTRLDEIPQLINVLQGDMSFVGTRPEVPKYVKEYKPEMLATLLMVAGITSKASIMFKDEDEILGKFNENIDKVYIENVLSKKMYYNINYIENFTFIEDYKIMLKTAIEVFIR